MNIFIEDVLNQVEHIEGAYESYKASNYLTLLDHIAQFNYSSVLFVGMGSSNYACYSASMYLKRHGIPSSVTSAGELFYYELNSIEENTLIILVSQSGESPEIIRLVEKLKDRSNVIGITNVSNSTLGRNVKLCLPLNVKEEISVSSRTYTTTVIMSHIVASCLINKKEECFASVKNAIDALRSFINTYKNKSEDLKNFLKGVSFVSCMGRGPSYGSALAGSLFFKEASKFPSEGTDAAEFRHGPIEVVDEHFGAVVFAPEGITGTLGVKMANDIAVKGGKVLLVTDQDVTVTNSNIYVLKYTLLNEYYAPIIEIAAIQFICDALAGISGIVPGEFRWASKVTREE